MVTGSHPGLKTASPHQLWELVPACHWLLTLRSHQEGKGSWSCTAAGLPPGRGHCHCIARGHGSRELTAWTIPSPTVRPACAKGRPIFSQKPQGLRGYDAHAVLCRSSSRSQQHWDLCSAGSSHLPCGHPSSLSSWDSRNHPWSHSQPPAAGFPPPSPLLRGQLGCMVTAVQFGPTGTHDLPPEGARAPRSPSSAPSSHSPGHSHTHAALPTLCPQPLARFSQHRGNRALRRATTGQTRLHTLYPSPRMQPVPPDAGLIELLTLQRSLLILSCDVLCHEAPSPS